MQSPETFMWFRQQGKCLRLSSLVRSGKRKALATVNFGSFTFRFLLLQTRPSLAAIETHSVSMPPFDCILFKIISRFASSSVLRIPRSFVSSIADSDCVISESLDNFHIFLMSVDFFFLKIWRSVSGTFCLMPLLRHVYILFPSRRRRKPYTEGSSFATK